MPTIKTICRIETRIIGHIRSDRNDFSDVILFTSQTKFVLSQIQTLTMVEHLGNQRRREAKRRPSALMEWIPPAARSVS
jgi:hypothetical protein